MSKPILRVEDLTVSFDGFKALDGVSLSVMPGTVRVIIGPNGAGKSTLLDAIIGRVRPHSGRIIFKDQDITSWPEHKIVRQGIVRKFQTPGVLENLTVEENLALAVRKDRRWWSTLTSRVNELEKRELDNVVKLIGLEMKRCYLASSLSHGEKQWLELGMVLATGAELVLLDEPACGMTREEVTRTANIIRTLMGQRTFLVTDHDLAFIGYLGAPVTVFHMGKVLCEGTIEEVRRDPRVVAVYLGRGERTDERAACGTGA